MNLRLPKATAQPRSKQSVARSGIKIWAGKHLKGKLLNTEEQHHRPRLHPNPARWRIDPSSLQFRLTLGVTAFSILGLGGVAGWTSWMMQQILINTHTENIKYIAERFPDDVELYSDMFSVEASVQKAIEDLFPSSLLLWIRSTDGEVMAQSPALNAAPESFINRLLSLSEMPLEPRIYQVGQRYLVLCSSPLRVDGRVVGQVQLAQDITADQVKLMTAVRGLSLVSLVSVALMAMAIALYIQRSLRPLRRISQTAGSISANELSQAKVCLDRSPTEVKELADKLNEMLSRLAQSWEQQKQLIGDISHELRTPLSVAYGSLQCIQRRSATLNDTQREMLETAIAETHRTIELLQSLLDLARADSGCLYLRSETLVLNQLVENIARINERLHSRTIRVEAENDTIWVNTDRNCLNQILTNLIDNAAKYSPPDQPILIMLSQAGDDVKIQVRDYGCGIPPEQQARIFDRFYRIDDARSRETGGVGLGLAIVKTLVEGMGGQITLWSRPGEGSTFTVILPARLKS